MICNSQQRRIWNLTNRESYRTNMFKSYHSKPVSLIYKRQMQQWKYTYTGCHTNTFRNALQWRHNDRDGLSNHRRLDCLLNRLCRCKSHIASKLRVTGLCVGDSPVCGEFPEQSASNAEHVSIWLRHHGLINANMSARCIRRKSDLIKKGLSLGSFLQHWLWFQQSDFLINL